MQLNFDATNVAPNLGLVPVPAGIYMCTIVEQEQKPTAKGDAAYLAITWQITEGEFTGRKVFERLNLWNANPTAVEMANGTLSAILRATGKIRVGDSSELLGQSCKVEVSLRGAETNKQTGEVYEPQNRIKAYHSPTGQPLTQIGGAPGGMPCGQPQQAPPQAQGFPPPGAPAPAAFQPPAAAPASGFAPPQSGGMPGWATGQPIAAPVPQASAPVVPAAPLPIKRLTAKANGATMEQFIAGGWTEEAMIAQGYLEVVSPVPAAPVAPPMPPQAPAAPVAQTAPQGTWQPPQGANPVAPGAGGPVAPWAQR